MAEENYNDNVVDAWATLAVVSIVIGAVVYWLSGMPS